MNSLEAKIDAILTQYIGTSWKALTGSVLLFLSIVLNWSGYVEDQRITDAMELAAAMLLGIGIYHKSTRAMRTAEKALAQSHGVKNEHDP